MYNAIKETPDSNTVIKELNAAVYSSTFKIKEGIVLGDLYTFNGTQCINPDVIVSHKSCPPVMGIYVKTIEIVF